MPERRLWRLGAVACLCWFGFAQAAPLCQGTELRWTAFGQNFDPSQTHAPAGPPRPVSDDRVAVRWWPAEARAELDWTLQTHYPFPAEYRYQERLRRDTAQREGADGFRPLPEGAVSPARRAVRFTELWLRAPLLWPGQEAGRSREISLGGTRWTLSVAREAGAPLIASAREHDPPHGSVPHELRYSGWVEVAGLGMPTRIERRVGGQLVRREHIRDVALHRPEDPACERAPEQPAEAVPPPWSRAMTHWILRRLAMGAGTDTDQTANITLEAVGDGVHQVAGGSHHALLVVGDDGLSLVDAPLYPARSERLLRLLAERWPDRPLREVILTHHHNDHSGGLVPLLETGAVLTVGAAGERLFREVLQTHNLDTISLRAVHTAQRITASGRELRLIPIPNSHAAGMLAVRVEDARAASACDDDTAGACAAPAEGAQGQDAQAPGGQASASGALTFVADIYSPGRSTQNPQLAAELLAALRWADAADGVLVGGHGAGAEPVSELVAWLAGELPAWRFPRAEPAGGAVEPQP